VIRPRHLIPVALSIAVLFFATAVLAAVDGSFGRQSTWSQPTAEQLNTKITDALKSSGAEQALVDRLDAEWQQAPAGVAGSDLLERVTRVAAQLKPEAKQLVDLCSAERKEVKLPSLAILEDQNFPAFFRNNLRLLYGRWLAQGRLYDEAQVQLKDLAVADVVDPAALLFYQGVLHHRLLDRDSGVATLERLLERESELPRRYQSLAQLMLADLSGLKEESLDHISRQMNDVQRRLDLGHAGPKVRKVEDDVIAALDKLIKQKEEQQQQQQQQMQAQRDQQPGRGNRQPLQPLPDSMRLTGKGPGDVTHKNIGNKSGWGDLPPKQREEALQQIGKEFPAHYRDVVEQYFRKLASEEPAR